MPIIEVEDEPNVRQYHYFTAATRYRGKLYAVHIVDLAMLGKLVEQDPADEPAAELSAEKRKLPAGHERRRKILKEKSVDAPATLFPDIPKSWAYAEIQELYDLRGNA